MTPFTQRAFAELLWDGMRQQYYRVKAEVIFDSGGVSMPAEFLPPVVRLAVALEFVRAYRQRFASTLTAVQHKELQAWENDLHRRLGALALAWANTAKAVNDWLNQGRFGVLPRVPTQGQPPPVQTPPPQQGPPKQAPPKQVPPPTKPGNQPGPKSGGSSKSL